MSELIRKNLDYLLMTVALADDYQIEEGGEIDVVVDDNDSCMCFKVQDICAAAKEINAELEAKVKELKEERDNLALNARDSVEEIHKEDHISHEFAEKLITLLNRGL